jgi:carboxypeptidase C (cathepsin A)
MADEGFQPAPPYQLEDNAYSLIDVSDLVFVDAIDTGFSRAVAGVNNAQFHDQEGDIRAFGLFIAEYLKGFSRWPSPKFLIGESYGPSARQVSHGAGHATHRLNGSPWCRR